MLEKAIFVRTRLSLYVLSYHTPHYPSWLGAYSRQETPFWILCASLPIVHDRGSISISTEARRRTPVKCRPSHCRYNTRELLVFL